MQKIKLDIINNINSNFYNTTLRKFIFDRYKEELTTIIDDLDKYRFRISYIKKHFDLKKIKNSPPLDNDYLLKKDIIYIKNECYRIKKIINKYAKHQTIIFDNFPENYHTMFENYILFFYQAAKGIELYRQFSIRRKESDLKSFYKCFNKVEFELSETMALFIMFICKMTEAIHSEVMSLIC